MPEIIIYTMQGCPYCERALALLRKKRVTFTEISVETDSKLRHEVAARAGRTSVPQIFFGETHIGGSDELYGLERAGRLDQLLADKAQ